MLKSKFKLIITFAFILVMMSSIVSYASTSNVEQQSFSIDVRYAKQLKKIDVYKVAEYKSDEVFQLLPEYANIGVDINNLQYSEQLAQASTKLINIASLLTPNFTKVLNSNTDTFENLEKGVYLILVEDINNAKASSLVYLPYKKQAVSLGNDVVVIPKTDYLGNSDFNKEDDDKTDNSKNENTINKDNKPSNSTKSVKTGDINTDIILYMVVFFMSLTSMLILLRAYKKI